MDNAHVYFRFLSLGWCWLKSLPLTWGTQALLCKPRPIPGLDGVFVENEAESSEPMGFFRSLGTSLPARASLPASGTESGDSQSQSHADKTTESMIASCDLPQEAKDRLRRCAGWDARYVLSSYEGAKSKDISHVKNPVGWVNGILKRMEEQSLVTPPEWDALLLSLDDLDVEVKSQIPIPLKQIPFKEAKKVVETLRKDFSRAEGLRVEDFLQKQIEEVKKRLSTAKQNVTTQVVQAWGLACLWYVMVVSALSFWFWSSCSLSFQIYTWYLNISNTF